MQHQLTGKERDDLIRGLKADQDRINKTLEALGLNEKAPQPKRAADGGPSSEAHIHLTPKLIPTMLVIGKDSRGKDREITIAQHAFDPTRHRRIDEPEAPKSRKPREIEDEDGDEESEAQVSDHDHDELLTMTVPVLRALPEVTWFESQGGEIPKKKAQLVDLIMDVRAGV